MSAPRRPGGGDRRPGRPAGPGARRPRDPKPDGERGERPAKPARVRSDGSVASGGRKAREARAEGTAAPATSARTRDKATAGGGGRRPAEMPGERPAKPARVRSDGSVASGSRDAREARAEGTVAPATSARTRDKAAAGGGGRRPAETPGERSAKPARVRRDGSVAGGSHEAREARAEGRAARAPARPPRARGKSEGAAPAKPGPRTRADGSVATHRAERPSKEPQRIAKLLARAGIASRREIERMIAEGRIAIDGTTLDTPATTLTSLRGVTVDGKPVAAPEATRLFLFHKPAGFLTTERDPRGRPTIYDRLPPDLPRLVPVGRLDLATEGLLLLTTDGGFKRQLELPATGVPRVYRARAYGEVSQDQLEALIEGVEIDGVRYGQIDANLERRTGRNVWIEMVLTEGKNREVRRVLEYLGLQVSRLIRTAYGPFLLGDLPSGGVGEVKQHDLVEFRKTLR